jgi:hydrogenase maturation protein HypF
VTIEAFAVDAVLDRFVVQLQTDAPSSARIVDVRAAPIPNQDLDDFVIESSAAAGDKALSIPPDLATCRECETEVLDPSNRRYGYAFTNCTTCGPRFTIATGIPYDRAATTMSAFEMCTACRHEYDDVEDRRFHAQPNACPECGPSLRLVGLGGDSIAATDPLRAAARRLNQGSVVASKGPFGFYARVNTGTKSPLR